MYKNFTKSLSVVPLSLGACSLCTSAAASRELVVAANATFLAPCATNTSGGMGRLRFVPPPLLNEEVLLIETVVRKWFGEDWGCGFRTLGSYEGLRLSVVYVIVCSGGTESAGAVATVLSLGRLIWFGRLGDETGSTSDTSGLARGALGLPSGFVI